MPEAIIWDAHHTLLRLEARAVRHEQEFLLGSRGMPRRYYNYLDQFQPLHAFSTYGSWVLGAGLFMILGYLLASLFRPMDAPANPWGGTTLEWKTQSPPIKHNFEEIPILDRAPYDYRKPVEVEVAS